MRYNKTERKIIMKMAECCAKYYEPYDDHDTTNMRENNELEIRYETLKELLLEEWGLNKK